jgi:hypothetical protein
MESRIVNSKLYESTTAALNAVLLALDPLNDSIVLSDETVMKRALLRAEPYRHHVYPVVLTFVYQVCGRHPKFISVDSIFNADVQYFVAEDFSEEDLHALTLAISHYVTNFNKVIQQHYEYINRPCTTSHMFFLGLKAGMIFSDSSYVINKRLRFREKSVDVTDKDRTEQIIVNRIVQDLPASLDPKSPQNWNLIRSAAHTAISEILIGYGGFCDELEIKSFMAGFYPHGVVDVVGTLNRMDTDPLERESDQPLPRALPRTVEAATR